MIPFDIAVPVFALALGAAAIVYVRWLERRLERQMRQPPAE